MVLYSKVNWQNGEAGNTPVTAENLDHMDSQILTNSNNIGDMSLLETKAKNNLVSAINEAKESGGSGGSNVWETINGALSFSSYDSITKTGIVNTSNNLVSVLNPGMKIRFNQGESTKYGFITGITNSSLTVFFGNDYFLEDRSIVNPAYSMLKSPTGFSQDPEKWTLSLESTTSTLSGMSNNLNKTPFYLKLPVGLFTISYSIAVDAKGSGGPIMMTQTGISNGDSNTVIRSSLDYLNSVNGYTGNNQCSGIMKGSTVINNQTEQNYYILLGYANSNGNAGVNAFSSSIPTIMSATCAYL